METPTSLEYATIEELFAEIGKRTRAALLVITIPANAGSSDEVHLVSHHGGWATAVGLARYADYRLLSAARLHDHKGDPFDTKPGGNP